MWPMARTTAATAIHGLLTHAAAPRNTSAGMTAIGTGTRQSEA